MSRTDVREFHAAQYKEHNPGCPEQNGPLMMKCSCKCGCRRVRAKLKICTKCNNIVCYANCSIYWQCHWCLRYPEDTLQHCLTCAEDVKSVSCSVVATSVAIFEFLEFVCDCGSVEEFEFGGNATSNSFLESRSDGSNESVGCTSVRESEHVFPASPPDERPWCGECDNFIESNQELTYCGIPSCRWVLHHNCVRPHYSRRHSLQPIPDGFEM